MRVDTSNLTRKTAFVMAYNIYGATLGYVTLFIVMRLIGTSAWGILGAATGMVGLLTIFADFGLSGAHVKKISEGGDAGEKFGAYFVLKMIYSFVFLAVSFAAVFFVTNVLGFKFENEYLEMATYIIILYFFLLSLANIFRNALRARMETTRAVIPDFIRVTVQNVALISASVWWVYNSEVPKEWVGVLYSYGYLISVFAQIAALSFYARRFLVVRRPSLDTIREYLMFSIPLGFFGIVGLIQSYTDRAMLQFFWSYNEVGGYFGVQKITLAIMSIAAAINFVLYPAQAHHYSWNDLGRFRRVTNMAERYITLIILPLICGGVVFAPEFLNLWNLQMVAYADVLRILLIYSFLYVLNSPYTSLLVSAGLPKENLKAGAVQALLNVLLNAILIPSSIFGVTLFGLKSVGAALATLLSYFVGFTLVRYWVYRNTGVLFNKKLTLYFAYAAVSSFVAYLINTHVYHFVRFYEVFLGFTILLSLYFLLLYLSREVTLSEITSLIKSLFYR